MKYFLNLVLVLSFFIVKSQSFVEVIVSDSVLAKPDFYVYRFDVSRATFYSDEVSDTVAFTSPRRYIDYAAVSQASAEKSMDSIKKVLAARGFKFGDDFVDTLTVGSEREPSSSIISSSPDSLRIAYQILKSNKNVKAYIQFGGVTREEAHLKKLFDKIMKTAATRASAIANTSGKKLGELISVVEQPDRGFTSYPPLSGLDGYSVPGWHTTIDLYEMDRGLTPIYKTFTVRYSLK